MSEWTVMHGFGRMRRQRGVSLIELMVAMVLGLLLTAGVLQIFSSNNQAYRFHDALSRIQENGRFALDELTREIRMAGYLGCSSQATSINNWLAGPPADFDPRIGIQGWEANGTEPGKTLTIDYSATPVSTSGGSWTTNGGAPLPTFNARSGSDIVRIWRGDENIARIVSVDSDSFRITANHDFAAQDLLMLSDCRTADWVQACSVTPDGTETEIGVDTGCALGNDPSLEISSSPGGEVSRIMGNIYYVSRESADAPPALFRSRLTSTAEAGAGEPFVEGVENLQILFGVDTNGDRRIDEHVTADAVADWRSVVAVRVSLLLVSTENNIVDEPQPVFFNGVLQTPTDRRLRQVMTTTIALRNRMP